MGGEKLHTIRIVFLAALFAAGITAIPFSSFAQEGEITAPEAQEPSAALPGNMATLPSEESFVLGEDAAAAAGPEAAGASIGVIVRMVLVLALAALAIYGVVFLFKRLARPAAARDPNLKVLASVPLGGDTFAAVVSLGTKAWLVGGGSGAGVSLIAEVEDQETLETLLLDDARKNAETGLSRILDFKALLNRFGNKNRNAAIGAESGPLSAAEALRKQRERLKGLRP